ncbi:hypothetical protein DACRYDRAFT_119206 [Dacryopinax primogenitus]|uniref:F-box domain-containing protein n=1 Tax=Dacryopinax primogenitus (strain DJM 731) TaxID=1858805 RepID=M5G158_DACPD|nr:uncharacterized protein DACRYDRAFT_119206 [Dacryopinax primogenitus]EJT97507.1 hypothetical protein DACRYDRAFT_119206 [Dacryopinax primogenitus]
MHRALTIPEVCCLICEHIDELDTLHAVALTCARFRDVVLPRLWEDLPCIEPLAELILQDIVSIRDATLGTTLALSRYAHYVKKITSYNEDSDVLRSAFFLFQTELQLSTSLRPPNLREITMTTNGPLLVQWLIELIPPCLEKLSFVIQWQGMRDTSGERNNSVHYLSQLLEYLPTKAPGLKSLTLDIPDGLLQFLPKHLPTYVHRLSCIEEVDLRFAVPLDALSLMGSWEHLERLKVCVTSTDGLPTSDFTARIPSLKYLNVSGSATLLLLILQTVHFPSLRALALPHITIDVHLDQMNDILMLIAERFSGLQHFEMEAPPAQSAWSPALISFDPLYMLLKLRNFHLTCARVAIGYMPAQLDDTHLLRFPGAWASLECLDIRMRTFAFQRGVPNPHRPSFTLRGLLPLAKSCRQLKSLFIGVDLTLPFSTSTTPIGASSASDPSTSTAPENLGFLPALVMRSFELECISVAPPKGKAQEQACHFIASMWPNVHMKTEGEENDNCDPALKRFCALFNRRMANGSGWPRSDELGEAEEEDY